MDMSHTAPDPALPTATAPTARHRLRINCTIKGRYALYFRDLLELGLDQTAAVQRLIDGAMTLSLRQAGPEIDAHLYAAKAIVAEAMLLARPEIKTKLQSVVESLGKAHHRMRQVQAM